MYFLDTSALVKRYHLEPGSPVVIDLFHASVNQLAICSLSLAETLAVLARRRHRAEISQEDFETARFRLALDLSTDRVGLIDVERRHIIAAHDLILQHVLSGTDAVILACALDLTADAPVFVCADTRSWLLRAAEACGLSTLNPLSPAS